MSDDPVVTFPSRWTFANIASAVALLSSIGGAVTGYVLLQANTEQLRKEVSMQWEKLRPLAGGLRTLENHEAAIKQIEAREYDINTRLSRLEGSSTCKTEAGATP